MSNYGFFLRPVDLGALTLLFVAILIGCRLIQLRPLSPAGRFLAAFYACIVGLVLFWLLTATRLDIWSAYAIQFWGVIWAAAMVSLIQYAYNLGDVDPKGSEARKALRISLIGLAVCAGWAIYLFMLLSEGKPASNILVIDAVTLLGFIWALTVVVRQVRRNWRQSRNWAVVSHLLLLSAGLALVILGGATSILSQVSGQIPVPIDFGRVYIVTIAITLIGLSYLLYRDTQNFRVNRVIAASLVLLQTAFTLMGFLYTAQFQANNVYLLRSAETVRSYVPPDAGEVLVRQQLDAWTRPIFAGQAVISVLAIGLLMASGARIDTFDQHLLNLPLSERQIEIIALVMQGQNNQEIAKQLMISENSVKYHLKLIYEAINLSDRQALALWYKQKKG
ncbi:MAG: LuxR C-terminal-related transcriptional regulator [Anaerolineales bacterium]